jgi:Arc/MetJ-type ribon-helix-helix transcriptional regulator
MDIVSVKIPAPLAAKLNALVRRRGQRKSVLIREAIERLVDEGGAPKGGSVLDLMIDLKGIGSGPKDLATNPKYMKGYGK